MTSVNLAKALAAAGVAGRPRRRRLPPAGGRGRFRPGRSGGLAELLFGRVGGRALVDAPGYGDWLRLLLPGDARPIDLLEPRRIADIIDQLKARLTSSWSTLRR